MTLITDHLNLVDSVLFRDLLPRLPAHADREDLRAAGMFALVRAERDFHPSLGPFVPYARLRIRGGMLDHLRSTAWGSREDRKQTRRRWEAEAALRAKLNRPPQPAEVAAQLGITIDELQAAEARHAQSRVLSADAFPVDVFHEAVLDRAPSPEDVVLEWERLGYLLDAIDTLTARQRIVIRGIYYQERDEYDLGDELGVTASRVSQIHAEALRLIGEALLQAFDPGKLPPAEKPGLCADRRRRAYRAAVQDASAATRRVERGRQVAA